MRWSDDRYVTRQARYEQLNSALTPSLFDALRLTRGERVLDVGSGFGTTTLRAGGAVRPNGSVVGIDISPAMVAAATQRAAHCNSAGLVSFRVADAQTDDIDGAPFDVAMSRLGVMFFDDPVAAFANLRRHLRSGGRLGFVCWQARERNPWAFGQLLADLIPDASRNADDCAPGPFALADPGRVGDVLEQAGFGEVGITAHFVTADVTDDAVVDDTELLLMGVADTALPEAHVRVKAHLDRYRLDATHLRMPLAFLVVKAARVGLPDRRQ